MSRKLLSLLALVMALGTLSACGQEKAAVTRIVETVVVTATPQEVVAIVPTEETPPDRPTAPPAAPPKATAVETAPEPSATPTEIQPEPSATPTAIQPEANATPTTRPGYFGQDALLEDARQLAEILESTHPDPYFSGGGRIAFHRRLQHLLNSIPEAGMTEEEFTRLLIPFVAGLGDGHTVLSGEYSVNQSSPGGVPLHLAVIEEHLYVAGVPSDADASLLGSLLVSVEGIPVAELSERQERMEGTDNQYHALQSLADESLYYEPYMQDLIPEWEDTSAVAVELQRPTGEIEVHAFDLPIRMSRLTTPESQVTLPSAGSSGFAYEFLDEEGQLAYLHVDDMGNYAEGNAAGRGPSATEMFRTMVIEMEEAGTETLIVDLRKNQGGSSVMGDILVYFLYGKETLGDILVTRMAEGGCGSRLSREYFEDYHRAIGPEDVDQSPMLVTGDYDFSEDFSALQEIFQESPDPSELLALVEQSGYADSSVWYEEYQSEAYSGYYLPEDVLVLVSAETYSAGANMMQFLSQAGAVLVGTPSSQVTNSFGEGALFVLDNTSITGFVSTKYCIHVPPDSVAAHVWPVDYPLTYEKLAAYDFDPNAEYLYGLELLSE